MIHIYIYTLICTDTMSNNKISLAKEVSLSIGSTVYQTQWYCDKCNVMHASSALNCDQLSKKEKEDGVKQQDTK